MFKIWLNSVEFEGIKTSNVFAKTPVSTTMLKVEDQLLFIANEFIEPEGSRMRVNMAYLQKNTNLENNHNMEMNF